MGVTSRTRTRALVASLSAALFIVVAGCGSSSTTITAPDTPAQRKVDRALAKQAVLKLSDLPRGFRGTPPKQSSGNDVSPKVEQQLVACAHLPKNFFDDSADDQPKADSHDFEMGVPGGAVMLIQSSVEIDRSSKDLSEVLAYVAKEKTVRCFQPYFRAAFAQTMKGEPGISLRDLTVEPISAGSAGDQGAGFRGHATITAPRGTMEFFFDFLLVRTGRAAVIMAGIGIGEPVTLALEHELLAKMVGRLEGVTTISG